MATSHAGENNTLRLRDGRVLGWAQFGDPEGIPLLYFHGQPGSRLGGAMLAAAGSRHGVRVIAPDRPGYGLSDFKPGRALLDWADDVTELTEALKLPLFAVAGLSSGGPYVSVCAHNIPERLTCAIIVSGNAPFDAPGATDGMMRMNRWFFGLARRAPFISDALMKLTARAARNPVRALKFAKSGMPPADIRVIERREVIGNYQINQLGHAASVIGMGHQINRFFHSGQGIAHRRG